MRYVFFLLLCCSWLVAEESRFEHWKEGGADSIPYSHVSGVDNDYLTGYVQALLDVNYLDFQVRVLVLDDTVYVFNLPRHQMLADSIICFLYDIPCICHVECVCGAPEDFMCYMQGCDDERARVLCDSPCYNSICEMPRRCQIRGVWLPQNTLLFAPLIADPRQVMNSAALRFGDDVIGERVGAASFGGDFIIFRWKEVLRWCGDMDIGIQAGIFSVFDLGHVRSAMVNTDFFIAPMLTYAVGPWSYRFRIWHLSSHVGDEFLLTHPGFERCNLSDEGVDFFVSYWQCRAMRIYAGLGYIFDRDLEFPERPFYFEWGAEIRCFGGKDCFDRLYVQPFLAMHFRSWEEHNYDIDQTYAIGVEWSKLQGIGRKARIWLEYHDGYSKEGQFVRQRSNYFATKLSFGF